jgi:8-oxo-dGTP pyrophosphatase MutT (NUDIX family)
MSADMSTSAVLADSGRQPWTTFSVEAGLEKYNVPLVEYRKDAKPGIHIEGVAISTTIFDGERVLLVQRSAHDSSPGRWETPGGAVDLEDATILEGGAREVWEEAGLVMEKMIYKIETEDAFTNRAGLLILKMYFYGEAKREEGLLPVKLSDEHQDYVWATKEEVEKEKCGDKELPFTWGSQKLAVLLAFQNRETLG